MISKKAANYRLAEGKQRCGNCSMFSAKEGVSIGNCTLVLGTIRAHDTCDYWEAKKKGGSEVKPPR